MNIRVSIVEDNAKLRSSIAKLIEVTEGFECVSTYANAESAIVELPNIKPDVVVMDINLPGASGVDCVGQLKPKLPDTQIVMFTVYENTDLIFKALAAGATGYLLKSTPPPEFIAALRELKAGGSPMTSHIARKVVASFAQPVKPVPELANLTPREQEVLDLLAKGFLYKEIADQLGISFDTVHSHVRKIYEKLHVRSRTEAVTKFHQASPKR